MDENISKVKSLMLSTYQVNKLVCKYAIRGTLHNIV